MSVSITSGETAVLGTNSTASAFALTEGFSDIDTLRAAGYGIVPLSQISQSSPATSPCYTAAKIRAFGVGADNATFDYRVWAYTPSAGSNGYLTLIGAASNTLGTLFGSSNTAIPATNRIADTVTFDLSAASTTPTGPWSDIYSALACDVGVYSPANNTSALVILPDLGSATHLIFDFDMTGATSGNVAVELFA